MSAVKCFDIASEVIEEASDRFAPIWSADSRKIDAFRGYCEDIDAIAEEFDGVSLCVEVDETTMEVVVELECGEIVIQSQDHVFYGMIKRASQYGVSVSEDGNLLVRFVFPSLWSRV